MTRREAVKAAGVVAVAGGGAIPVFSTAVRATDSGEPELTLNGTIPDAASVDATVEEYDTQDASSEVASQTNTFSTGGSTLEFANLDGQNDYYYVFDLALSGDGNTTPELESLVFEVPQSFETVDYTDELEWRAKRESTTIAFDEQYLYEYQPMLRLNKVTREQYKGLYGYVARSEEHETDALCYWSQLTHQNGLPGVRADSHLGDHEPIYVFVNSETGGVEEVVYTAYHWFTGSVEIGDDPSAALQTEGSDSPTHATFSVVPEWHNYQFNAEQTGALVELKSWPAVRETWVQNGFYEPANVEAIEDPWQIREANSWWEEGSIDAQIAGIWANIGDTLGWYGADKADEWR